MIRPEQVWLATEPVDGRWGMDRLTRLVIDRHAGSSADGKVYVFCNRDRTRLKLLHWDGTGVWLAQRRLHRGRFVWPQAGETHLVLETEQWRWLVAGVDWQRLRARQQDWRL